VVIAFHHSDARIGAGLAVSLVYQGLVTLTHENGWARAKLVNSPRCRRMVSREKAVPPHRRQAH
jgi:hypothetical protein